MRVLLINPRFPVYLRMPNVPLGLVSIASYLRAHGDEICFIDRTVHNCDIKNIVKSFCPEVIGISCHSYLGSLDAKKITSQIREICDAPIVWGGQAPSSLPELFLREGKPDYLSLGEGELTIYEFVRAVETGGDFKNIAGLAFLEEDDQVVFTPKRHVADLTTFPEMDWSFIEPKKYFSAFFNCTKMLYLHASKGCTACCTFCGNKQFHEGRNRCRDPKHVMHDLEYLVGKCGANGIYFSDELFVPNRRVRNELMHMIICSGLDFKWGCQIRLGVLNEDDIDLMYEAGCRWILFGIESGSEEMLGQIKKNINLSLAKPTIDYCQKKGMTVQATFIIGFPGETCEQMQQTIDLALSLNAGLPSMNILVAVPNSEIYFDQLQTNPAFKEPRTLKEASKIELNMQDKVSCNFSKIPKNDIYVVHYYFQWMGFTAKDSVSDDSFGIVKKLARDTFYRLFKQGVRGFFFGLFNSVKQLLRVFYYSHFFPKTLKRYGLK